VGAALASVIVLVTALVGVVAAQHGSSAFFGPAPTKQHRSHNSDSDSDSGGSDSDSGSDSAGGDSSYAGGGVSVRIPCTAVVTDVSMLTNLLAEVGPDVVICVRGGSGAGGGWGSGGGYGRDGGGGNTSRGPSKKLNIWLTGYSWQDNTPPGSSKVSHPILHKQAGGTGTYQDPITVAVPGKGSGIWKAGARFYLPTVQRYVIVEDTGASPPHSGEDGHLDMWIGGQGGSKSATDQCMDKITGDNVTAELNPPPNLPVIKGPIYGDGGCNIPGGSHGGGGSGSRGHGSGGSDGSSDRHSGD
jgi:hypothetical protein